MSDKTEAITIALPTEPGTIPCPVEGCVGSIVERDRAIRWNTLEMVEDGSGGVHVWASTEGEVDFESDPDEPFACDRCLQPVAFEDDFQIEYD